MRKEIIITLIFQSIMSFLLSNSLPIKLIKPDSLFIGTRFKLEVKIPKEENFVIQSPKRVDSEKVDLIKSEFKLEKNVYKYLLTLAVFDTGKVDVPSIYFYQTSEKEGSSTNKSKIDSLKTQSFSVFVLNSLTLEDSTLKDIKPPLPYYLKLKDYLFPIFLIIILNILYMVITGLIQKRKLSKIYNEPVDNRPAWQIAMEMLVLLQKQKLLEKNDWIEYHYQLSLVIRLFLEKQFGVKAVEMTTAEIRDSIDPFFQKRKELLELLSFCDMIKFAKYIPPLTRSQFYEKWLETYILEFKPISLETSESEGDKHD